MSLLASLAVRVLGFFRGMPEGAASHLEAISKHVDAILGPSAQHFHEHYSPDIHVDLIHYAPTPDRDFHYLLTSGMSDRAMTDGGDTIENPFVELVIALPSHWDVSPAGFNDPKVFQPIKLIKQLARYPHENGTFVAKYHSVAIGDDPLASPMRAILLMPPVLVPELREPLQLPDGNHIQFLAVYLIHQDELELKIKGEWDNLLERFGDAEMTELYDLSRPSVL